MSKSRANQLFYLYDEIKKNNILLIGETGIGKTTIAKKMAENLTNHSILYIDCDNYLTLYLSLKKFKITLVYS